MAPATEPDLDSFTSSDQIFSTYTLPQIRAIHRNINVAVEDKQTRLRTQVGGSYRELLGTADSIVRMRTDNDAVRTLLASMGSRCGPGAVAAKVAGMGKFAATRDREELGNVARLRLLEECAVLMERLLRVSSTAEVGIPEGKGERLLLCTKVFLLSKCVTQTFADKTLPRDLGDVLERSRKQITKLRQKLVRNVDRTLRSAGNGARDNGDLLCAMCASVAQSSAGDRDALQRMLHVRANAIATLSNPEHHDSFSPNSNTDGILKAVRLYSRTLLEVQDLVPDKLRESLSALKRQRLVQDVQLRQIESLRLDVLRQWCDQDVQYYTPFLRHDDLDHDQARNLLARWADQGTDLLVDGLRKTVARMTEFGAIVDLRTRILQLWIQQGGRARGFDPSEMHDSFRLVMMQRLLSLVDAKVSKLHLVGSEISSTLGTWQPGVTDAHISLWDKSALSPVVTSGSDPIESGSSAVRFLKDVVARLHGRSDAVARAVSAYDEWRGVISQVRSVPADLRALRWENDVDDLDELDDQETIEERTRTLSGEDPDKLQKRLDDRLVLAFQDLESRISELWSREVDGHVAGPVAMYLIRVLRDIRLNLPDLEGVRSFGLDLVPSMHERLATMIVRPCVEKFRKGPLAKRTIGVQRTLWDDDGVPVMPSVGVFGFIKNLHGAMTDAGLDLWSPQATGVLKRQLGKEVKEVWHTAALDAKQMMTAAARANEEESVVHGEDAEQIEGVEGVSPGTDGQPDGSETRSESGDGADPDARRENPTTETSDPREPDDASEEPNATTPPTNPESDLQDLLTQWLFDTAYLHLMLGRFSEDIKALSQDILAHVQLEEHVHQRIDKAALDYHRRTSLLFSLFASRNP